MINSKITIAIDGYSSCGKSTTAKALASKLNYVYIDSGAMYRAVTLYCLQKKLIKKNKAVDSKKLIALLDDIHISFKYNQQRGASDTYLNDENVEKEIRLMEVSSHVSKISTIKEVRQKLIAQQQKLGKKKGVVMDGRDVGTAVFPDAELKLFMTADVDIRTQRRYDELKAKGEKISFDDVRKNLEQRDYEDTHRKENPLVKAPDAIILDNSDLDEQQQLDFVLKLMKDLGYSLI
jgi:CMP/dCMP kinase